MLQNARPNFFAADDALEGNNVCADAVNHICAPSVFGCGSDECDDECRQFLGALNGVNIHFGFCR